MKKTIKLVTCSISLSLLLAGCFRTDQGQKSSKEQDPVDRPEDQYESVLTYTGDGYTLPGGEENENIAKEHKEEVVKATKDFLKKEYNIDVDVHNLVGNKDGVTVFFETSGRLHFYSTAIVPIKTAYNEILSEDVWTLEGNIEESIRAALYAYIKEDELKELNKGIDSIGKEFDIVGRSTESLENVGGNGYTTPFYHVSSLEEDLAIKPVYDLYLENPDASKEELSAAYDRTKFDPSMYTSPFKPL
ncbi:DUF1672 family protein [Rossellomorea marisflavi]|uniref:DUF1672 family protein n=1 Tax=Rossellomorea marisflavi TaxID=189381 RepID=UPI00064FAC10|nr:DUF1672 family protein [Rossellomorea marisflavi]KML33733.1 hypothetical protein VL12_08750 [Rossellomorea marisflavi]